MLDAETMKNQPECNYMDAAQREFFKNLLLEEKRAGLTRVQALRDELKQTSRVPDVADAGDVEHEKLMASTHLARYSTKIADIDHALKMLEDEEYGYCEFTGEPIGIERLLACPTTTCSVYGARQREKKQSHYSSRSA